MLRAIFLIVTSLAFCAPAFAYSNAFSRGVADFLNIFSEQPVPRQVVPWSGKQAPGTVVVSTRQRRLYYVLGQGQAIRYGVGVGREGFGWTGQAKINMKRDWPDWVPPQEMIERDPQIRAQLEPTSRGLGVRGGPKSPLGARTLYLFGDGRDLGYRIHGTTEPYTVGTNVSSGCIRMINQDIIHLYARVALGTPVTVLPV